tara:strand:+ start:1406 stop:2329 length:924 start_codon:yes stop_codon:yes gene_type:complete
MPPKEKKTADKKAYQAQYRKDHPKSKEEQKEYMRTYIADSVSIDCPVCKAAGFTGSYKSYNKYKHDASKKHQEAEKILKAKHELKKREEEEAALQKKALEEAEANRNKPKRTIKIKKKKVEEKKEEPKKEEEKPKRTIKIKKKKEEENIKMEIKEKPKEKHASLKALEEYASSSDEEKEEEEKLEDTVFCFQPKEIDSEAVAKFIQEHHEKSANPARSAESKTPRLNKNASLWRKVSKELDGKKWSYLGGHFGEIVSKAYDKPSSQADFVQMLKMVVMHFTKVPAGEEKALNMLARKLKTAHVANQK